MRRVDKDIADLILEFLSRFKISEQWFLIILSSVVGVGGALVLFIRIPFGFYPVVNSTGKLEGILSLQDIRSLITKRGLEDLVIVKDVMPGYTQTLTSALQKFGLQDVEALPVVDRENPKKLVGVLKRSDIITFYNRKLLERTGKS